VLLSLQKTLVLLVGTDSGDCFIINLTNYLPNKIQLSEKSSIHACCWNPGTNIFAAGTSDGNIHIADALTGKKKKIIPLPENPDIYSLAWSTSGIISVCTKKGNIFLVNVTTGQSHKIDCTAEFKACVSLGPTRFAASTRSGEVFIFQDDGILCGPPFRVSEESVRCITADPSGRRIGVGCADGISSVWDVASRVCITMETNVEGPVRTVALAGGGNILVSGTDDENGEIESRGFPVVFTHVDSGRVVCCVSENQIVKAVTIFVGASEKDNAIVWVGRKQNNVILCTWSEF